MPDEPNRPFVPDNSGQNNEKEANDRLASGLKEDKKQDGKNFRGAMKSFGSAIKSMGKNMGNKTAQTTRSVSYGMYGVADRNMKRAGGAVASYFPTNSSNFLVYIALFLHLYLNLFIGTNVSDVTIWFFNLAFGTAIYFTILKGDGPFNLAKLLSVYAFAILVSIIPWGVNEIFGFFPALNNNFISRFVLNPVLHPMWVYFIIFKQNTRLTQGVWILIILFWMALILSSFLSASNYGNPITLEQQQNAWSAFTNVKDFLKKMGQDIIKIPRTMRNFTDRQMAIATGDYYTSRVEQNKDEPLGVYISDLESADPQFYTDEAVTIWATLTGKSFLEEDVKIKLRCNASNSNHAGEFETEGEIYPKTAFDFSGLLEEYLDCRFEENQLRSGSNKVTFYSTFDFKTLAYLKTYLIDRQRLREMRRENIDPLEDYSDKNPVAVYTNGPIAIGMGTNTPPIAVDDDYPLSPKLGITIENRWKGRLKNITQMQIMLPEGMSIPKDGCDATHPFEESTDETEDGYVIYELTEKGKNKLTNIKSYAQPIKCRVDIKESVLGATPVTTKYIRVLIDYIYEVSESTIFDVKYMKNKEETTTKASTEYFGSCTVSTDAKYDSTQGSLIVSKAKEIAQSKPPYKKQGYREEDGGYDTSGFVYAVYSEAGICGFNQRKKQSDTAPTIRDYSGTGKRILSKGEFSESELRVGDLLFFDLAEEWSVPDHVAIYLGDGKILDSTVEDGVAESSLSQIKATGSDKTYKELFYSANRYAYTAPPLCGVGDKTLPKLDTSYQLESEYKEIYDQNGVSDIGVSHKTWIDLFSNNNGISSAIVAALITRVSGLGKDTSVKESSGIAACDDETDDFEQIKCAAETLSKAYEGKTRLGNKDSVYSECPTKGNDKEKWMCVFEKYDGSLQFAKDVWSLYTQWYKHICIDSGQGTVPDLGNEILSKSYTLKKGDSVAKTELEDVVGFTMSDIDKQNSKITISQTFSDGSTGDLEIKNDGWYWTTPFISFNIVSFLENDSVKLEVRILGYSAKTLDLRENYVQTIWSGFVTAEYDNAEIGFTQELDITDVQENEVCTFRFTEEAKLVKCTGGSGEVAGFSAKILDIYEGDEWYNDDHVKVQFYYDPIPVSS